MACYVQEGLYIGDTQDARDKEQLLKLGVTHILTLENKPIPASQRRAFNCKYIYSLDMPSQDLLSHFPSSIEFIEDAKKAGGVLVHCFHGVSRSATIVLAYLMNKMDLTLDDALLLLKKCRGRVRPNKGFLEQLQLFERMGCRVDERNKMYKKYRLAHLALNIRNAQRDELEHTLTADPNKPSESDSQAGDVIFKCRKCRRPLFRESSVLPHPPGEGSKAFSKYKPKSVEDDVSEADSVVEAAVAAEMAQFRLDDAESSPQSAALGACGDVTEAPPCRDVTEAEDPQCSVELFIEPVEWMASDIMEIQGKINCPRCCAKLGSFNWPGERCPCGRWVTGAFHIAKAKVDRTVRRPTAAPPAGESIQQPARREFSTEAAQT